jgi:hypothetical protein
VVVAAFTVDVAMRKFFVGRFAHVGDLDREVQGLARERVVAIDGHVVALDLRDGDVDRPLVIATLELHARLQVFDALERGLRHDLDKLRVAHAVTLFRHHVDLELIAGLLAFQRLLEARDDMALAVDVSQRLATVGAVDDVALVVGQRVVEGNDVAIADLHEFLAMGGGNEGGNRPVAPKARGRAGRVQIDRLAACCAATRENGPIC